MTPEEKLEKELESLTDEELAEYEAALLEQSGQAPSQPTEEDLINEGFTIDEGEKSIMEQGMDMAGSVASGFLAASQAVPGAKQISAAAELVGDAFSDPGSFAAENIYEKYSNIRKDQEAVYDKAKEENPWINTGAEIGTAMTAFGALGKVGFAQKGLKAAVTTTPAVTAMQAYTRDSDVDITEVAKEMGIASLFDTMFLGAGKAVRGILGTAKGAAKVTPLEALAARRGDMKKVVKHLEDTSFIGDVVGNKKFKKEAIEKSLDRFTKNMFKGNRPIIGKGLEPAEMLERSLDRLHYSGKKLGDTLARIDDLAPDVVDSEKVYRRLKSEVIAPLMERGRDTKHQELAQKLMGYLDDNFYKMGNEIATTSQGAVQPREPIKYSLSELHKLYRDIAKQASFDPRVAVGVADEKMAKQYSKLAKSFKNEIENMVSKAGKKLNDPELIMQYQADKLEYQDLLTASEVLASTAKEAMADSGLYGIMQDLTSLKGITTAAAIGASAGQTAMIAPAAGVINVLRASDTLPATLATHAHKVAGFMEKASISPEAQGMVRKLVAAATISATDFEKELTHQSARAEFLEKPLSRNVDDVVNRSSYIKAILAQEDEALAEQFEDILDNGTDDDIAAFMSEMGRVPGADKLIEQGIGFNGKLYTQEEKDYYMNEVGKMRNLPRLKRLDLKKKIQEEGYIPSEEDLQDPRQPRRFVPRDKSKLRY